MTVFAAENLVQRRETACFVLAGNCRLTATTPAPTRIETPKSVACNQDTAPAILGAIPIYRLNFAALFSTFYSVATPSLVPRYNLTQNLLSEFVLAVGYGVGTFFVGSKAAVRLLRLSSGTAARISSTIHFGRMATRNAPLSRA